MIHFLCLLAGACVGLTLTVLFVCAGLCADMALIREQLGDDAEYREQRDREVRKQLGFREASALLGFEAHGEDGR